MPVDWTNQAQVQQARQEALAAGLQPQEVDAYIASQTTQPQGAPVLPIRPRVTQVAGNYNPNVEIYSGGYARDTNFAVPLATPVSLPPGQWQVEQVYNQAPAVGGRRGENNGYGNMVKVKNLQTGDSLLDEHLFPGIQVKQGQTVSGGTPIGYVGASGNATGPNLGTEYEDANGKLGNVMGSQYGRYFLGEQ